MKFERDLEIIDSVRLNERHFLLKLKCDEGLSEIKAGQFVEIRIDGAGILLRRPISINYIDEQRKEMWLMIQEVGRGTKKMGQLKVGEKLNIVYPLGNGFMIANESGSKCPLLVGGGVGVAPILYLAKKWSERGIRPTVLLGARRSEDLLEYDLFRQYGDVFVTTEDGSEGEKGFVTQHSVLKKRDFDLVCCCGPTPMMKAMAKWAKEKNIECKVSLENKMACGLGACLCCVEETNEGNVRVCVDGPVFDTRDLKW